MISTEPLNISGISISNSRFISILSARETIISGPLVERVTDCSSTFSLLLTR